MLYAINQGKNHKTFIRNIFFANLSMTDGLTEQVNNIMDADCYRESS